MQPEVAKKIAEEMTSASFSYIEPVLGGRNSHIFRLVNGEDSYAIKFFRSDADNGRDRFDAETIYRFTFITPVGASAALNEELRRTTYSFRRLSDAEAAELKPRLLKLVSVRSGDSQASMAQRMTVDDFPLETFRVINGLVAGQPLRVGQQVKLIVE